MPVASWMISGEATLNQKPPLSRAVTRPQATDFVRMTKSASGCRVFDSLKLPLPLCGRGSFAFHLSWFLKQALRFFCEKSSVLQSFEKKNSKQHFPDCGLRPCDEPSVFEGIEHFPFPVESVVKILPLQN